MKHNTSVMVRLTLINFIQETHHTSPLHNPVTQTPRPLYIVACQAHPALVLFLRLLTDKLYIVKG